MNGIQLMAMSMKASEGLLQMLVGDFSDSELFVRPTPGANHVAWQIGNIILGDPFLVKSVVPNAVYPEFPAGFADLHGKKGATLDQDAGFLTKAGYLKLLGEVRAASVLAIAQMTDADLDKPSPEGMSFAGPTIASVLNFVAVHTIMHAGQFSVIRRVLGKPVLI